LTIEELLQAILDAIGVLQSTLEGISAGLEPLVFYTGFAAVMLFGIWLHGLVKRNG
jgi:hypothetical protein